MNKVSRVRLRSRLKAAIRAFRGKPVGHLYLGVDVKRCSDCRGAPPVDQPPKTFGDQLRRDLFLMGDTELATWLARTIIVGCLRDYEGCQSAQTCRACWERYLKMTPEEVVRDSTST